MKNEHEAGVRRSAARIAASLPEHIQTWVDPDDVAQKIAEMRLKYPQRINGHNTLAVKRELSAQGRYKGEPATIYPNTDLRPTETAVMPRMFWREVWLALTTPSSGNQPTNEQKDTRTIFKILSFIYRGGSTREEIARDMNIDPKRVGKIHSDAIRRLRGRGRVQRFRPFLEE